jgi:hypothetical protein
VISLSAIVVAGLWLAREIGARVIRDAAARMGRVGFIREGAELTETVVGPNGERWQTLFVDREGAPRYIQYSVTGHLYNESDTPLLLRDPKVIFWGEDGPRIRHSNPKLIVGGSLTSVVTVPAHGSIQIGLDLTITTSDLPTTYADAIPILELDTTSGRFYRFPLSIAMWRAGKDVVAWDSRRNKVVRAGTNDWIHARWKRSLGSIESRSLRR